MRIATPVFFCFQFAWNIFFHPLTFSLYVSLVLKLSHTMSSREQVLPICSALINGVLFFLFFLKSAPVRGQLEIVFLFFDFVSSCRTNGAKFGTSCYGVFICSQGMLSKIARHILTPYYCSMWGKLKKIQKMDLQYSMALATVMESLAR